MVFYIPKTYKNITPFLIIKNLEGQSDIIKLSQTQVDKNYNIFSVALSNSIAIVEGQLTIAILGMDNSKIFSSEAVSLHLSFENYNIGHQIQMIDQLSKEVILAYRKIEELTKMNIEIYEAIEQEVFK